MANARAAAPRTSRLRRSAPGLIALAVLSTAAVSAQAVAHASESDSVSNSAASECSNLGVGWGAGLAHNGTSGRAELTAVTVTGLTSGCVGREFVVSVRGGDAVLSTARFVAKAGQTDATSALANSVDVASIAEVSVTAG